MVPRESPSMSNSHHTSQGRRNKLSVWVKKIINTTTTTNASVSSSKPRRGTRAGPTRVNRAELDPDGTTISSSLRPLSTRPTIFSNRTFETNSSVLAIPPQSILDRSRTLPPSNASNTTTRRP
ncbi:ASN_collapsed_G0034260.mRNA.1.CDS.1 [Saccharomyces cerevisiae]|nr:ASN_collapsed_G0034260.mRNA.1.CDS.1 [Saccharomyces cerevisiae]